MPPEIIAAIIGAVISGVITWFLTRSAVGQTNSLLETQLRTANKENKELGSKLNEVQRQAAELDLYRQKYQNVKNRLQASSVVREYVQPVILVGPRSVGKTSLLAQWHAPWDHSRLSPTQTHSTSVVPIYDFMRENVEQHFADPDIWTAVHVHLKLKVHDFPGELGSQRSIIEQGVQETLRLRQTTQKSLGLVLICMFDASETANGLSQSTISYYNGELFSNLRNLVAHNQIGIERLVLVFNKLDLLRQARPQQSELALLKSCLSAHEEIIRLLRGICNPERVCEVLTILDRTNMAINNKGAPIVLGEASRRFVEVMAGVTIAREIIRESATSYAAPYMH